jgi:hypothetical protein
MFSRAFWLATLERAAKSAAQAAILFWGVGDGLLNLWTVNPTETLGFAAGGFVLSVLTSLVSIPVSTTRGPSLGPERVEP